MGLIFNGVRVTCSTVGTGDLELNDAVPGWRSFLDADVPDGATVAYSIREGLKYEIGLGVYDEVDQRITRATIVASSSSNTAISLEGHAEVFIDLIAEVVNVLPNTLGNFGIRLKSGTEVTANRDLTIKTGDNSRVLDLSAGNIEPTAAGIAMINAVDAAAQAALLSASGITVSPTGGISSTNVQAALAELDSEKATVAALSSYQPLDNDLTVIGAISPSNDDIIQRKAGAWTNRTLAQYASDISALGVFQPLDSDLAAIAALTTNSYGRGLLEVASTAALQIYAGVREVLTANRTYYVRSDGSNSNNGLSNSSGGAFLTLQKALDVVAALDISIYTVTIKIGHTVTFTAGLSLIAPWVGTGTVILEGDTSTPANTAISTGGPAISLSGGARLTIKHVSLRASASNAVSVGAGSVLTLDAGLIFGATANGAHLYVEAGGVINSTGSASYTINGSALWHLFCNTGGCYINRSTTITLTGTPAFSGAFAILTAGGIAEYDFHTFSGSATGSRYSVTGNSVLKLTGDTLPGNAAGTTGTGGQVV